MTCMFSSIVVISILMVAASKAVSLDDCIEYIPGNFNMIITAPHGGDLAVPDCPSRTDGCLVDSECYYDSSSTCEKSPSCKISFAKDLNTEEVARKMAQSIASRLKKTPHLLIMKCSRRTVDVNREINQAAQECPNAETVYNNYHSKISSIISTFTQGKGLLLDLHAQIHRQNRTEFGYAICQDSLDYAVADANHNIPPRSLGSCSIRTLLARLTAGGINTNWDILVGKKSMGAFLENEGFGALPGPAFPPPGMVDYSYLEGAYTIRKYSSAIDAIQMECPGEAMSQGSTQRTIYAAGLAGTVSNFYQTNFL